MRIIAILVFCLIFTNCGKVEKTSVENVNVKLSNSVSVSKENKDEVLLKPVTPTNKLNQNQQKYLDDSIPSKVREVLEKAEKFEILAEMHGENAIDGEGLSFEPNRIAKITTEDEKKRILEALYHDASSEDPPATCYEPHHDIKATFQGKIVNVEICFSCSRFIVKSEFGKFEGTIVRKDRQLENLLNEIVVYKSLEIKK